MGPLAFLALAGLVMGAIRLTTGRFSTATALLVAAILVTILPFAVLGCSYFGLCF